jgi:peptidoglycan hydrolase-like protein with peptidoglycan-binding domain
MADARHAALSAAAVLLLSGAAWAAHSTDLLRTHPGHAAALAVVTGTAPVVHTDVLQQTTVTGTLTYAGSYSVIAPGGSASGGGGSGAAGSGMITWLPAVGATVSRGEPAYELSGQPVPLLYGARPAWRDLGLGISSGSDIRQLKRNLAALGYGSGLVLDGEFDLATQQAVENWQQAEGLPVTGTVPLGQVVFLPGPLLVSQQGAAVGGPVPNGTPIVAGTGTTPDVQVPLDPNAAPAVRTGNRVLVSLPGGAAVTGVVTQVGTVAVNPASGSQNQQGAQQQPTIPVTVRLLSAARGALDQTQVQVSITSAEDRGVLAVPITALLAQPGGQFAVVVVNGNQRRTVAVQAGLFDETAGDVEVSGAGLAPGQRVEVPSQ